jgi:hypothetical protein
MSPDAAPSVRDWFSAAIYLLPLAALAGVPFGGAWGALGAALSTLACAVNVAAFAWLVPRLLAGGAEAAFVPLGFATKSIGILVVYGALGAGFGPYPTALGLVAGLGGVCIRRLLSTDPDPTAGYMGRPEGTGTDEGPG